MAVLQLLSFFLHNRLGLSELLFDLKNLLFLVLEVLDILFILLLQRIHLFVLVLERANLLNQGGIADTAVSLLIAASVRGLD